MYLTHNQHDSFRTLLMGFEIPFRTYIAKTVISKYPTYQLFEAAMVSKRNALTASSPEVLKNNLQRISSPRDCSKLYSHLQTAVSSSEEIVSEDTDVPMVCTLNVVTCALTDDFGALYTLFNSYNSYCDYAEKYRYARNKLDHPGSRTLEERHLTPVLSFVKDICMFLDDSCFLQKDKEKILSEVTALQQHKITIPIDFQNFSDMPYNESRIVCRDNEIQRIKDFIYGKPENLRKQHSCCIYGYGGVGKTALVIETIKQIVCDILDQITVNEYAPAYILFFSAKKRKLDVASETGQFIEKPMRSHFETKDELVSLILSALQRDSLRGFQSPGIIVVDNLETLSIDERQKIKDFIDMQTPSEMQFILTSRNSEEYDSNIKLGGFESDAGKDFIASYCNENSLEIDLSDSEIDELISLAKGNTLIVVLSLRRLSKRTVSFNTLKYEFSSTNAWKSLRKGLSKTPSTAYEAIAEFMYKDTFEHIETAFSEHKELFYEILKVFAVTSSGSIDINTICLLTKESYPDVEGVLDILCSFLILEKNDTQYSLNGFAENYIVSRFLPDAETYNQLSRVISDQQREVSVALEQLKVEIRERPDLRSILIDWNIIYDIDRVYAAKMYKIYGEVKKECDNSSRFKAEGAIESFMRDCDEAERLTAHPYIKFQKARIFQYVDKSNIFSEKHTDIIKRSFCDSIYCIDTIELYSGIKQTKSYASLHWLYGQYLYDCGDIQDSMRHLEKAKASFEENKIIDQEYYKCCAKLGSVYLDYYDADQKSRISYLRRSRGICSLMYENRDYIDQNVFRFAKQLKARLSHYGQY